MSAALAVKGATAFVCLTLRKRGLMPKRGEVVGVAGARLIGKDGVCGPPSSVLALQRGQIHELAKPLF